MPTPVLEVTDELANDPIITWSFDKRIMGQHRAVRFILCYEHGDLLFEKLVVRRHERMTDLVILAVEGARLL